MVFGHVQIRQGNAPSVTSFIYIRSVRFVTSQNEDCGAISINPIEEHHIVRIVSELCVCGRIDSSYEIRVGLFL